MFGVGMLAALLILALYALTQPIPYYTLNAYCATDQTDPNTYSAIAPESISIVTRGVTGLAEGTYFFRVAAASGYTASPANGTMIVRNGSVFENITFSLATSTVSSPGLGAGRTTVPATSSPSDTFPVSFLEQGLADGISWSVTLNNTAPPLCSSVGLPPVCTFPAGSISPGPNCYQTMPSYPSIIPPTITLHPLSFGPLPLGSLTEGPGYPIFYSTWQGIERGADWSLLLSVSIVGGGFLLGLLLGAVAGLWGGVVDEAIMRLVDVFLSIPQILFVVVVVSAISITYPTISGLSSPDSRVLLLVVAFLVTWWPTYTRIVRGQVLVVREQKFVEAARASGAGRGRILLRHIIPNSVTPALTQMTLDIGTVPAFIGSLVFLGFTNLLPSAYFPEWGTLSALSVGAGATNVSFFLTTCQLGSCVIPWWQLLFPGLVVFLFAISANLVSDGLRDAFDSRTLR